MRYAIFYGKHMNFLVLIMKVKKENQANPILVIA
ncbi:uncharacterized protein METZ01_LOCUS31019 [marine metagenome]|uniref:Uncharacterized protein n=1 Tax=marine metagenome TaxID=408172 RepID=A0A381QFQ4_9ZZZZ